MSSRNPETQAAYDAYRQELGDACDFCSLVNQPNTQVIDIFDHFLRIYNRFPYSLWDGKTVKEHQMIIPKQHVIELNEFTADAAQEFLDIITRFEQQGFSLYARSQKDKTRSIAHQHTHLIKLA